MKLNGAMRRAKKKGDRKAIKHIRRVLKLIKLEKRYEEKTLDINPYP